MIRRPPRSTRTDTLFPYTTLFLSAVLARVAAGLRADREPLSALMSAEMGKLHREALAEIDKSAAACDYYAERAGDYLAEQTILTEARRSYVSYEPTGCVLAIMPWNFPIRSEERRGGNDCVSPCRFRWSRN